MEPLRPIVAGDLTWVHVRGSSPEFQLVAGGRIFATLRRESVFHTVAAAEAADGRWTLSRLGLIHPKVLVRQAGLYEDIAIVETGKMGEGTLRFADGRRYAWVSADPRGSRWAFIMEDGSVLVRFRIRASLRKYEGVVQVESGGLACKELSLFVLLGWYLIGISLWSARLTAEKPIGPAP